METFHNLTTDGNEEAIKRGPTLPDGAVNLAWVKTPVGSPAANVVVVDTTAASVAVAPDAPVIGYANALGALETASGDILVTNEFPVITDEFLVSGDITDQSIDSSKILPFVHESRYFYLGPSGLAPSSHLAEYKSSNVKVIDSFGNTYADSNGNALFRIKIIPPYTIWPNDTSATYTQIPYRILVFINTDTREDLYLMYDKVELLEDGTVTSVVVGYQEILNPQPYFQYRPEESEVVDVSNINKKWYSTNSLSVKEKVLNLPITNIDGYKVYAPQKALLDPRLFQGFRWRVNCSFTQEDFGLKTRVDHPINCGVIITNSQSTSKTAQLFNIIADPNINIRNVTFVNPASSSQSLAAKEQDSYWYVNFDEITNDQLALYDFLIWAPNSSSFDFTSYNGKISYFTKQLGRILFIDTDGYMVPKNLNVNTGYGVNPSTGTLSAIAPDTMNPAPTNTSSIGSLDTWLPPIFIGILDNIGFCNPVPPIGSVWSTEAVYGTSISYTANNGTTYWLSHPFDAHVYINSNASLINSFSYEESATWYPPCLEGIQFSDNNPPPPVGSAWAVGRAPANSATADYLTYMANDGQDYWLYYPAAPAYAVLNPAVQIAEGTTGLVQQVQQFDSAMYPHYRPNGGSVGSNVGRQVNPMPYPQAISGSIYNFPATPVGMSSLVPALNATVDPGMDNSVSTNESSNLFDASSLMGWAIGNNEPISYYQTNFGVDGAKVQYILEKTSDFNTLVSGQVAAMTTMTSQGSGLFQSYIYTSSHDVVSTTTTASGDSQGAYSVAPITFTLPNIPSGTSASQININISIEYTNATTGLSASVLDASSTLLETATKIDTQGTLNLNLVLSSMSGTSAPYTLVFPSGNDALVGSIQINVSVLISSLHISSAQSPLQIGSQVQLPVLSAVPVVVENGNLIFSTIGIPQSVTQLLPGASQLLYNITLYATANKALTTYSDTNYASSFLVSSPWKSSWVINATDFPMALTNTEKTKYDFFYLPESGTTQSLWKRRLSSLNCEEIINQNIPTSLSNAIRSATRTYSIEVNNTSVQVDPVDSGALYPYAWTRSYTPTLNIPSNYKTYIVREAEVPIEVGAGTYINKVYPSQPYMAQVKISGNMPAISARWNAQGTATLTELVSANSSQAYSTYITAGTGGTFTQEAYPYYGNVVPSGLMVYKDTMAFSPSARDSSYPYSGIWGYLTLGSQGEMVMFLQDFLRRFDQAGQFLYRTIAYSEYYYSWNGYYDWVTQRAVQDLQSQFIYQTSLDGAGDVDSETWGLIGALIMKNGWTGSPNDYTRFYNYPYSYMQKSSISDGNPNTKWAMCRRQNSNVAPWTVFYVQLDQSYIIDAVAITAFAHLDQLSIAVDVITNPQPDFSQDILTNTPFQGPWTPLPSTDVTASLGDNQTWYWPLNGAFGNTIRVKVEGTLTPGAAFGVRDISADIRSLVRTTIPITASGTAEINGDFVTQLAPSYTGSGTLSSIMWDSATCDNPHATINVAPNGRLRIIQTSLSNSETVYGPVLPSQPDGYTWNFFNTSSVLDGLVYSKTINNRISPVPEVGMISKSEGLKLLCDQDGHSVGFPLSNYVHNILERYYLTYSLIDLGSDTDVQLGFYDITKNEFIVNANGAPEISYIDYITRGPQNVFVGVYSTFQVDTTLSLPAANTAPLTPNNMVMPAYGVVGRPQSKISLQPVSPNLKQKDIWPITVKVGKFIRDITIPPATIINTSSYLSSYQGSTVTAVYGIPEALSAGGWSSLYGYPNMDVTAETPIVEDVSTLQVRHAPILMVRQPTIYDTVADPMLPILSVSTRPTVDAPWTALGWSGIRDYNVSEGRIFLTNPLTTLNPDLVQVHYTAAQSWYAFKEFNGTPINLNPFSSGSKQFIGNPLYVYVVPQYVQDKNGNVIAASQQTTTLRFSLDTLALDPLSPYYDPTAVLLGIIYVSTDMSFKDLTILDTRRRGGGAFDSVSDEALIGSFAPAENYWDVASAEGDSYQDGGFVIVRLPAALRNIFSKSDISTIISRNLTAGVRFKLEDDQGNKW